MAISIKSEKEIELMTIAGKIVYETHKYLEKYLIPGITTKELEIEKIPDDARVGIMAGASTPQESIKKVLEKLSKIC